MENFIFCAVYGPIWVTAEKNRFGIVLKICDHLLKDRLQISLKFEFPVNLGELIRFYFLWKNQETWVF